MSHTQWKISANKILADGPVIPVIKVEEIEHAIGLAEALVAGGIRVLEITLRTPVAIDAIRQVSNGVKGAIVGAGTVTTPKELDEVTDAGALFAISPGLTLPLLDAAVNGPIALIPGISTVSELMTGLDRGYDHFKFFPAEAAGGTRMLKAIYGPFPQVKFCPTGGITLANMKQYLCLENVVCVGGSWLAPTDALKKGDWAHITTLAQSALNGI